MKLRCDIHTHTLYSRHAYSTIEENVRAAAEVGLDVLGSADHFSSMISPALDLRDYQFFINATAWPREWHGVTLLRGAEADIVSLDGALFGQDMVCTHNIVGRLYKNERTLFECVTSDLDYLVASIHYDLFAADAALAQTTQMYVNALEHQKVFMLGHTGRAGVPFDIDEVLTVAREKHKIIEINEHSFTCGPHGSSHEVCRKIAERCAELGVSIGVSTDAHVAPGIGQFPRSISMLEEIHFPEELIATRSREALLSQMRSARVCKLKGVS